MSAQKAIKNKAQKSGISYSILKQVYDRGMAAWETGHRPGTTQNQWAMARINSFISGGKTRTTADKDLWAKVNKSELKKGKIQESWFEDQDFINYMVSNNFMELEEQVIMALDEEEILELREGYTAPLSKTQMLWQHAPSYIAQSQYKGRKVTLNKPFRTPDGPKKSAVYVKNPEGNVVIVRFGDPNMEIKRDNPERRKSFRARHNCQNPGPKHKARFWSCKEW